MEIVDTILKNQASFLFILFRVTAFFFAFPVLGGAGVPNMVKALIVLSMTFVLFQVLKIENQIPLTLVSLTAGLIGEVLVGMVIGLGVRLVFGAVEIGSAVIGMQMGFGTASLFDPVSNQQVSLINRFQGLVALLIFFSVNGHHILIRALVQSFEAVPTMGFYPDGSLISFLMILAGKMFLLGVKISLPIIVSLLMANVTIGILGRVVPQMNVLLFSFPVTIMLGLMALGISLPFFATLFQKEISKLEAVFPLLLKGMQ
ncbi:MAG: flagellar biosynthetic protein FliR [Nitrospiria bacterium]